MKKLLCTFLGCQTNVPVYIFYPNCWLAFLTLNWRHDRITLYTAVVPEQKSRPSKGKHQESNPETDSLPQCQVCAALSLAYHTLRVTWATERTPDWHQGTLSATRQGRELETTAGNSSWDKAEERTEHARYQFETHLTVTLGYDFKGNYNICRSTVFVFQLSATAARKCELHLGEEGIRSRIPCPLFTCPARHQCLTVHICQTPKVFYAAVEDQNALSTEMADVSELI